MNIDDILSINLLKLIAYHIQNDHLDKHGIYMAHRMVIKMDQIEANLNGYDIFPVCKYNGTIYFDETICNEIDIGLDTKCVVPHKNPLTAGGDFMLLHGLYD